ncbi:FMN-binding negative transcriptional regulator [Xanthomonas maliensis]|uniref:FMN-binding negative transcriptional regulator n=1 Tax=Xanthomonas maliensis TaxID=1321368 RepID=UPI0003A2B411|nr:FMN-binding negative transcriptional regulator [Xanthomonas maliensis]KAB7764904.1 FMN-binding negative transcriptional regulator [Xanthomonas maliensis]
MYLPSAFRESRAERLAALMRAHPFASVVSAGADGPAAEHLPLELIDGVLCGHVARGNPLARLHAAPVLAVFQGPDGYVSPNWYPDKALTGREVPTWNYAVVQVHGRLQVHDDATWLRSFLRTLTARHEADEPQPWSLDDAPADYLDSLLRAVVGIAIVPTRIDGKFKLGQNKSPATRRSVIAELQRRRRPADAGLAELTAQTCAAEP